MKEMNARRTLVIGASSSIGQAVVNLLAKAGDELFLVARDEEKLKAIGADLSLRYGIKVHLEVLDVLDFERHESVLARAFETFGRVDLTLIFHGSLPDQKAAEEAVELTLDAFSVNALSVIGLLTRLARRLEAQRQGTVAVVTSVAGDRGRRSNYIYGSAKGAVSLFLQGLRSRLHPFGVRVLTVKPGFVDTPMTAGIPKGLLWASPEQVAKGFLRALAGSGDVVYLPWYWRWIMLVVRVIPERVFKRLAF